MANFLCQLPHTKGAMVLDDEPLGRGGEGAVYAIRSHQVEGLPPADKLVAKVYHTPEEQNRVQKIVTMVQFAPESTSVAWPLGVLATPQGKFVGYVMDKLASDTYRMWAEIAHSKQRKEAAGGFDVQYALTAALNLALAISSIHEAGHRVGDINESNIFVGADASVLIVDTDSAQIQKKDGSIFPCLVGKPEYTAAELSHGPLKDQERTTASDTFGYAVAVYQLLVGGAHPTDGIFKGAGDPPDVTNRIRQGIYPNLRKTKNFQEVARVPSQAIPSTLRQLLLQALSPHPEERPTLEDFEGVLAEVLDNLEHCSKVEQHWYDRRDRKCGWCQHAKEGNPDPWNLKPVSGAKAQRKLPAVSFKKSEGSTKAPRARAPRAPATAMPRAGGIPGTPQAPMSPAAAQQMQHQMQQMPPGATQAYPPSAPPSTVGAPLLTQFYECKRERSARPISKGKTLLPYNDGSERPRPPLMKIVSAPGGSAKLAYECFINEQPSPLRLCWNLREKIPATAHLILGLVLALLISASWWFLIPAGVKMLPIPSFPYKGLVVALLTQASIVTSILGSILLFLFTLREKAAIKKVAPDTSIFPQESPLSTIGKMCLTALGYGPLFVLGVLLGLFFGLISFLGEVGRQGR